MRRAAAISRAGHEAGMRTTRAGMPEYELEAVIEQQYRKHGAQDVAYPSIVAGGAVRAVAELAGISDLLSKMLGSSNKVNNVVATIKAFASFNPAYVARIQQYSDKKKAAPEAPKAEPVAEVKEVEQPVEKPKEAKPAAKAKVKPTAKKS